MEQPWPQHLSDDPSSYPASDGDSPVIPLPSEPMAPLSSGELPSGSDWGYQLKWDGVRMLARLNGHGQVELFSRKLYLKNAVYPEIVALLEAKAAELGPCLLDGEVVWWDGIRPNFQQVLKRERSRVLARHALPEAGARPTMPGVPGGGAIIGETSARRNAVVGGSAGRTSVGETGETSVNSEALTGEQDIPGSHASAASADKPGSPASPSAAAESLANAKSYGGLVYVLFDLLADGGGDLSRLPYEERHGRLTALIGTGDPRLFATDLFQDGEALWSWVEANRWEGVVSKRLSSPYREGKKHRDWLKKKIELILDVDIVGLKWRNGIVASLVMELEGGYLGSVSLGLNDALRRVLASTFRPQRSHLAVVACPFPGMPEDLKNEDVQWLSLPFRCRVTGLELTSAGQLRHPKLVTFLPKEPLS
ncbi:ATP-dependent DNA ligase [Paenibacillus glycinis]|uniref:ATP-dependent DNA ligase family profile domain-containing protein n=1 Tax=Paenibacillus glycinis TaxID=2697035 RepID=A0ABW9XPF5_9BACL|nr:hypothetical protein [Paenibacillus glycinis]NBD24441.1 hypothetical protein [Paenibacillus glycinis]